LIRREGRVGLAIPVDLRNKAFYRDLVG